MHIAWDVPIVMDDGAVLVADVYRPSAEGVYPVILNLGPYGKGYAFQEYAPIQWQQLTSEHPEVLRGTSNAYAQWETVDPEKWTALGYAVVRVDARGTGCSPGFMDPWSSRERHDYYGAIEWAGVQPWSNGKVGLAGVSYHAANQWMVATLKPPHLAAICIWEGMADFYRDAARHGGILCDFWVFWIKKQAAKMQHGLASRSGKNAHTGRWVTGDDELPAEELERNRSSFETALVEQEFDGPFYRERSADPAQITVPLLSAGNWGGQGLHLRGNVENFVGAASEQKWLEIHGLEHWTEFYTDYGIALQQRFFDHFLKGEDNGWDRTPRVHLQVRYLDRFEPRGENEWPLARTQWTRLYLHPADRSLRAEPSAADATLSYAGCAAGATFLSAPLEEQTEITGPSALKLFLSSSSTDADVFAVLRAFDPDGKEVLFSGATDPNAPIGQGWLRASHRKRDEARSAPYRPVHTHDEAWPVRPGEPVELDVEIWPTCIVLPAGYRIGLTIQGKDYDEGGDAQISNSGNALRGSGVFIHTDPRDRVPERVGGTTTLHAGPDQAAYILLPIIPA
jgi:predicted acyl esterase